MTNYLLVYKFNKNRKFNLGKRIRKTCEELGTTYIKFGQMLSTRYELFSEEDCLELQKLLDDVKEIPYKKVKEIFYHDFQKYPEELFVEFNSKPIASASISQVYKAKLKTGEDVAIKVRRPYIYKNIKKDIKILKRVSYFVQLFSKILRNLNLIKMLDEFEKWITQEIDFINEKNNIQKIKEYYKFKDDKKFKNKFNKVSFVDVYPEFCSKNIITMSFVEGVTLNKFHTIKNNPEYDVFESIKIYFKLFMQMWFNKDYGLFQADPHPANLIIQKNGAITCIDIGLVGKISNENLKNMKHMLLGVYTKDVDKTLKSALLMCNAKKVKNYKEIRKEFKKYISKAHEQSVGYWFMETVKILIRKGVTIPYFISAFARCNFVMDGNMQMIAPNSKALDVIGEELKTELRKEIINNIKNIKYEPLLYNISEKIKESPEKINHLINQFYEDPVKLLNMLKVLLKF